MTRIKLHTRSFHPDATFGFGGLGFEGDSRGFKDDEGATSRIKHYFTINLQTSTVEGIVCLSDPSRNSVITGMQNDYTQERKQPRKDFDIKDITSYSPTGDQTVRLKFWYAGQNFAFPLANRDWGHSLYSTVVPDLDVTHDFTLRIERGKEKAHLTSSIGGDSFPNCESFMMKPGGPKCFIATHIRVGTAMTQLPGGRLLPMTRSFYELEWLEGDIPGSAMKIHVANDYTGDGSPQEVAPNGGTTRSAWNAVHLGRDASGGTLRQIEDHVPTGRQTLRQVQDKYNEVTTGIGQMLQDLSKPRY